MCSYTTYILKNLKKLNFDLIGSNLENIYKNISNIPNVQAFYKKDIPVELNYKNNQRIGDFVLISESGYSVYVQKQDINWTVTSNEKSNFIEVHIFCKN